MKKRNIFFFISEMGVGGAERTFLNIINNIDRNSFIPTLVTLNNVGDYESFLEEDIRHIKLPSTRLRGALIPLAKLIKKEKPDLIFSTKPHINFTSIIASILSLSGVDVVVREADHLKGKFSYNLRLKIYGISYKKAKTVISLSKGVQQNLIDIYKAPRKKIEVIYNPIDQENIKRMANEDLIESDKKKEDIFRFISVGRLVEQKDQATLIKAFHQFQKNHEKSELLLLGAGPLESQLKNLANDLGISKKVQFLGFVSNPYKYIYSSDVFVLSSKHEGFSHVIAEALACGTMVIATNCNSGPSEVLNNGEYGELVPVGDIKELTAKMEKLKSYSHKKSCKIVEVGEERVKAFGVSKIVRQYEEVFLRG
ncbi:glycosyltransferase [Salicibibacter halophilus]|uniref:Glycosyltransferase n=1 Tax=Salicibibacter halophilus TaxID=2502791 RepID=A0A514LF30_9BACI|nr:glycosyltransferase [Salicibibacter halophilus]QDI90460.1 glycosyltransferase [Salicibibacter halophilus]